MIEANTGTKPVAAQHAFDVATLERYLAGRLPGFRGPLGVEQFKGGQSNPTYKLVTPERVYVMRAKPGPVAKLVSTLKDEPAKLSTFRSELEGFLTHNLQDNAVQQHFLMTRAIKK